MIDPVFNPQNDRWIDFKEAPDNAGDGPQDAANAANVASGKFLARSKHPASAMFLGAVASTGETSPSNKKKALRSTLVPWMREMAARPTAYGRRAGPVCLSTRLGAGSFSKKAFAII